MGKLRVPLWFALSTAAAYLAAVLLYGVALRYGWSSFAAGLIAGAGIVTILALSSEMRRRELRKEVPA